MPRALYVPDLPKPSEKPAAKAPVREPAKAVVPKPAKQKPPQPESKVEPPVQTPRVPPPLWIQQARKADLFDVARALQLNVEHGRRIKPCPACKRSGGARIWRLKERGWSVWKDACMDQVAGNIDLVAYTLFSKKAGDLPPEDRNKVRQWFAERGWCDSAADGEIS